MATQPTDILEMNDDISSPDEELVDESTLSPEEVSAATLLGINTKRLSKKAYAALKEKAQQQVKEASTVVKDGIQKTVQGQLPGGARHSAVRGGAVKSAEKSAGVFTRAEPGLAFPTKGVAEAAGDALPSGVAGRAEPAFAKAVSSSPFLSRLGAAAASPAGRTVLKGMGGAGLVAGLYGDLDEGADGRGGPVNPLTKDSSQLTPQQLAYLASPGKKISPVTGAPDALSSMDEQEPVASSLPRSKSQDDLLEEIKTDAGKAEEQMLSSPEYLALVDKWKKALPAGRGLFTGSPEDRAKEELAEINRLRSMRPEQRSAFDDQRLAELTKSASPSISAKEEPASLASTPDGLPPGAVRDSDGGVYLTPNPVPDSGASAVASVAKPGRSPSAKPQGSKLTAGETAYLDDKTSSKMFDPYGAKAALGSTGDSEVDALTKASQEEGNYYKELLKRYDQAVTQRDKDISLANLQEAAAQIMMRGTSGRDVEYYKGLRSRAGTGITDFEKRKELEQEARDADPTSAESQSYRQLLKEQGIKLPDSVSAAFIKKQYPQFANIISRREASADRAQERAMRREEFALRREELGKSKADKEFVQLYDSLDPTKGRAGQFGEQYKIVAQADRLGGLIDKSKYGMNLTGPEMEELALGTARLLAGAGGTSRSQIEALVPSSARGKVSDMIGWITNNPTGRQQQEFVKRTKGLLDREKALAQDKLEATIRQRAKARGHLKTSDPGLYEEAVNSALETFAGRGAKAQAAPSQDPEVQKYADEHFGGDYQKAISFLEKRAGK